MRIAIVEDERKLAETLAEGLIAQEYAVDVFPNAESFLDFVENPSNVPDLLILDIGLPQMSGLELSKKLRASQLLFPILMLTAHDSIEEKVQSFDDGADDFLAKPFNFVELIARVRALLRRAAAPQMKQVTHADLVIDMRSRQVSRGGTGIPLTPTEFDFLMLLLDNRGKVLTREEISSTLWNIRDVSLSNIVDVHISNLRRKLDGAYATKHISTVRGLGYRIA